MQKCLSSEDAPFLSFPWDALLCPFLHLPTGSWPACPSSTSVSESRCYSWFCFFPTFSVFYLASGFICVKWLDWLITSPLFLVKVTWKLSLCSFQRHSSNKRKLNCNFSDADWDASEALAFVLILIQLNSLPDDSIWKWFRVEMSAIFPWMSHQLLTFWQVIW